MNQKVDSCVLVIFGASGDLTRRKLVPALFDLSRKGLLPDKFAVLGVSRTDLSDDAFRGKMAAALEAKHPGEKDRIDAFTACLHYLSLDTGCQEHFARLKARLEDMDAQYGTGNNYIYYLSIAPSMYEKIVENLGAHGMQNGGRMDPPSKRVIIEKPFGYDLPTALSLNRKLLKVFREGQIYRIDHYLGKETVQNVLVFRFANGIFEPLWNRNYIDRVEITAAEWDGVEKRGLYYDGAGAMRDMVQNHLLHLLSVIAMEPPPSFQSHEVRNEMVKVFHSLRPIPAEDVDWRVVRGQYTKSKVKGNVIPGYRDEANIDPFSRTETYVALRVNVDNWRWGGVPFYIRTGKRLPTRVTEAVIYFKPTPHILFAHDGATGPMVNQLIMRIQPDEGILLMFGMKRPGVGFTVEKVNMNFRYSDLADIPVPDAYERLLLDCIQGDATLFARGDAVESCWRFVDPIIQCWQDDPECKVFGYPAGSWGPHQAQSLLEHPGADWRYPCKNLVEDGLYCEL
ncbi:MAG: glucose-6-phosphate dehydrogenase [Nitrospinaceae bacterium]